MKKLSFLIIMLFTLSFVFAGGWHLTTDILPGNFQGNYGVNGTFQLFDYTSCSYIYSDADGLVSCGSGSFGDVVGPGSATDNGIVRFDGTTGKLIQDSSNVVIDDDGNVGIGTTSPGEKLEVNGNINVTSGNDICIEGGNCLSTTGGSGTVDGAGVGNRAAFWTDSDTLSYDDNFIWDNTNKRLGIGTDSPSADLEIYDNSGSSEIIIERSSNALHAGIAYYPNGTINSSNVLWESGLHSNRNNYEIWNWNSSDEVLGLAISNDGNVGIGTDSPGRSLHIKSKDPDLMLDFAENPTAGAAEIVFANQGLTYSRYYFNRNSNETSIQFNSKNLDSASFKIYDYIDLRFIIQNNTGNVGIGTDSPSSKLDVAGTIRTSTGKYSGLDINDYMLINGTDESIGFYSNDIKRMNIEPNYIYIYDKPMRFKATTDARIEFEERSSGYGQSLWWLNDTYNRIQGINKNNLDDIIIGGGAVTGNHSQEIRITTEGNLYVVTGNVGIGTITPGSKLEISGTGKANGISFVDGGYMYDDGSALILGHD